MTDPQDQAELVRNAVKRAARRRRETLKKRVKAQRGTKHPAGTTKAYPTPDERARKRKQAKQSRKGNR